MLIKETRVRKKNYTIALFSTDANSYQSTLGTPWDAEFFINMNSIMSTEEQNRPYYVHCTFVSQAGASVGNPTTVPPVLMFLDFQNNSYPHMFTSYSVKPIGMLKFVPDLSQIAPYPCYVECKTNDNEEIYISSLTGVNSFRLHFADISGAPYLPLVNFTCFIHLTPADF